MRVEIKCDSTYSVMPPLPSVTVWAGEMSSVPRVGEQIEIWDGWALSAVRSVFYCLESEKVVVAIEPDFSGALRKEIERRRTIPEGVTLIITGEETSAELTEAQEDLATANDRLRRIVEDAEALYDALWPDGSAHDPDTLPAVEEIELRASRATALQTDRDALAERVGELDTEVERLEAEVKSSLEAIKPGSWDQKKGKSNEHA